MICNIKRPALLTDRYGLSRQIDSDFGRGVSSNGGKQAVHLFAGQRNRQQLVVHAVAVKDVGEAGCNYRFKTEVGQCPWCVFTT